MLRLRPADERRTARSVEMAEKESFCAETEAGGETRRYGEERGSTLTRMRDDETRRRAGLMRARIEEQIE